MAAFQDAIAANADLFKGKVVLDVGCGMGLLSLWAAQVRALKAFVTELLGRMDGQQSGWQHLRLNSLNGLNS